MNLAAMFDDTEYEDHVITEVREYETGYELRFDSLGIGLAKQYDDDPPHGIVPKPGDTLRQWGPRFGWVRGMGVNGRIVFYLTEEEQRDKHAREIVMREAKEIADFEAKGRAVLDAKYDALPDVFKRRIDKFRRNNPEFRWKYESYEMFCCEEAVKLAKHLGTVGEAERYAALASQETYGADEARWHREWEEQKAIDRAAGLSGDHSGNTHGTAVVLALLYLKAPEGVEKRYGALAPLVGSDEYGCVPKGEGEANAED